MALTTGSARYPDDTDLVLYQARTTRETRQRMKALADASGLAQGLFLDRLLQSLPLDRHGRPECIDLPPDSDQKGLFKTAS